MRIRPIIAVGILALLAQCTSPKATTYEPQRGSTYPTYKHPKLGIEITRAEDPKLIDEVASWMGTPYKSGAAQKHRGTDCSGFTQSVYRTVYAMQIPRTSGEQAKCINPVSPKNLKCGMLLFFKIDGRHVTHTGIYIRNGYFVHSAYSKRQGIRVDNIFTNPYYQKTFYNGGWPKKMIVDSE